MKLIISKEKEQFIIDNAFKMSSTKIANHIGTSKTFVINFLRRNGIVIPKEMSDQFRTTALRNRTTFSKVESDFILENYLKMPLKAIAIHLNRSSTGIKCRIRQLGLEIPIEIREHRKKENQFKPGHKTFNKGLKHKDYLTKEQIEKTKLSQFKKGQKSHNALPLWTETIRIDSKKMQYFYIKVPNRKSMVQKHRWLWEQKHGKIKKGYNVVFKNGNTLDCQIENLECISDEELMSRNSIHNYPEEIKATIKLITKLNKKINHAKNNNQ